MPSASCSAASAALTVRPRFPARGLAALAVLCCLAVLGAAGCGGKKTPPPGATAPAGPFTLSIPGLGQPGLPDKYTCRGEGASPPLAWANPPADTRSFALKVYDTDARYALHMYVFNMPAQARSLPEMLPEGDIVSDGSTVLAKPWQAPCPKEGPSVHRLQFLLYALDVVIDPDTSNISAAMDGHVRGSAELVVEVRRN
jgi:Raf kinase inhibitor-like YbhB/YbcL family protein